jgi:hypothetical protein
MLASPTAAQSPTFFYRASDLLTVHRRYLEQAICTDTVNGAQRVHTQTRQANPDVLIASKPLTLNGATLSKDWSGWGPRLDCTHASDPGACDQGAMHSYIYCSGSARISAGPLKIVMTTVEDSDDEVEVIGNGACAGGGPIAPLVAGAAKTRSARTATSKTPFEVRVSCRLSMDSLFTRVRAWKFGPASELRSKVQSRIEVFRDVNANGTFEPNIDLSVLQKQGTQLQVTLGDPVMAKSETTPPMVVDLPPGPYIAILTFDHDFSVATQGNFAVTDIWSVQAYDNVAGSVVLTLR